MVEEDAFWRALSNPVRRRILDRLRERPRTTGELVGEFDLSRYAVMQHLRVLVDAGVVLVRREGRRRWNLLNAAPFVGILRRWVTDWERAAAERLHDLKEHLEEE